MVVFLFSFLYQQAGERFSSNSEVTSIFHCLIKNFNVIHVQTVSTNLYLTDDGVCNYTLIIGIFRQVDELELASSHSLVHIFAVMPVTILHLCTEIGIFNDKLAKYALKSKYWVNICSRNLDKIYAICCMFLLLLDMCGRHRIYSMIGKNNTSYDFFCAITILSVLRHTISRNCLYWKLLK